MKFLNLDTIGEVKGNKKVLVKDFTEDKIPRQFYVLDWSFGIDNKPRYNRYTNTNKGWKVLNLIMNNEDLIEIKIPYSDYIDITNKAT